MKNPSKHNIYSVPNGYFDGMPERLIRLKNKKNRQIILSRTLSAALVVVAATVLVYLKTPMADNVSLRAEMDQEVEFFINSGYWNAEDVISFSDHPNELLDEIIEDEWSGYSLEEQDLQMVNMEY